MDGLQEWDQQIQHTAAECGVSTDAIAAIKLFDAPALPDDEWEIYEFARQLQQSGQVDLGVYRAVQARWGDLGVVELAAIVASVCTTKDKVVEEAMKIAEAIVDKVPLAVEAAKRAFGLTEEMPLRDGYRYEQTQTALLADTEDTKEALAAFREKRKPVFHRR